MEPGTDLTKNAAFSQLFTIICNIFLPADQALFTSRLFHCHTVVNNDVLRQVMPSLNMKQKRAALATLVQQRLLKCEKVAQQTVHFIDEAECGCRFIAAFETVKKSIRVRAKELEVMQQRADAAQMRRMADNTGVFGFCDTCFSCMPCERVQPNSVCERCGGKTLRSVHKDVGPAYQDECMLKMVQQELQGAANGTVQDGFNIEHVCSTLTATELTASGVSKAMTLPSHIQPTSAAIKAATKEKRKKEKAKTQGDGSVSNEQKVSVFTDRKAFEDAFNNKVANVSKQTDEFDALQTSIAQGHMPTATLDRSNKKHRVDNVAEWEAGLFDSQDSTSDVSDDESAIGVIRRNEILGYSPSSNSINDEDDDEWEEA